MAGFSITSPTTTVLLRRGRDGRALGEASFTVANQTGHAVRARATAVAEGSTVQGWLEVEDHERNFQAGATETFLVVLTVPVDAAAGEHQFRVDAASVSLPDEEWGRGSSVRFQVPEVPKEPVIPEEPPGYLETVGGALAGGFAAAVVFGGLGAIVGAIAGTDNLAALILAFILGVLAALLGLWIGPVVGAYLLLRWRDFKDPWHTALPMIVLMPVISIPTWVAGNGIREGLGVTGFVQVILLLLMGMVAITVPALAARAFARWRETGHL